MLSAATTPYRELLPFDGALTRPLMTLHGTGDLQVFVSQEQAFKRAVDTAGTSALFVQRLMRIPGHCRFSEPEEQRAFDDLMTWLDSGVRPAGDDVLGDLTSAAQAAWLAQGHSGAEYDAWLIKIGEGDQFGSGFVGINPNSKIPAMMDYSENPPQRLFESGSILLYLAEKFGAFLPKDAGKRTETLNWLFWQMGSAPYLGGGFGHFYAYAPEKWEYPINRFALRPGASWQHSQSVALCGSPHHAWLARNARGSSIPLETIRLSPPRSCSLSPDRSRFDTATVSKSA